MGKLLAKSLINDLNFEIDFSEIFIKHLLNRTLYINDISNMDKQLYDNLEFILNNDVSELGLYFQYDL